MGTKSNSVESSENARIAEGDRHRILANEHRRSVIAVLRTSSTPISLAALATRVAIRADGVRQKGGDSVEQLAIGLHHTHLPLLAKMGVITYDAESKYVDTCATLDLLTN